jgi:hypothetical protein
VGKSPGKAPPPVQTDKLIGEQTQANKDTAQFQQKLNMVGSSGPGGSVKYINDPTQPGGYTQVTELDAGQQGLYDLGVKAQTGALGTANDQIGRINAALGRELAPPTLQSSVGPTDFTADREAITDAIFGRAKSRLDPMWMQAEDRLNTRLSNQGLGANSTAAITAREGFGRDRNDSYEQALTAAILGGSDQQERNFGQAVTQGNFANSARQQDFQNTAYAQNQPIDQFAALLGTGGLTMPTGYQGPTHSVNGTDVMGAYGLAEQSKQNAYAQKTANANSKNQAIAQIFGAMMPGK